MMQEHCMHAFATTVSTSVLFQRYHLNTLPLIDKAGRKGASGSVDVSTEMYLGHLCPIDEYRVYGYMTSTRLKILAVLEDVNDIREADLKTVSLLVS